MRLSDRTPALGALSVCTVFLCLLILLVGPTGADAAGHAQRVGVAPRFPHSARDLGRLAPRTLLSVDIALAPRDPAALSTFAAAVATPGSADYHHYLSVAQFRTRFAPSSAAIAKVRSGLRAAGLTPGAVSANGLILALRARASRLSVAFHTTLERVRLATGRVAYTNRQAPQFSGELAGLVQGVVGLNNLDEPHALGLEWSPRRAGHHTTVRRAEETSRASANAVAPCAEASTAASEYGAYSADQIASVYGLSSLYAGGDQGAGQTVAVMEFEPYLTSDIATYNACYGINDGSTSDVSETDVDGGVGASAINDPDGSGEAVLDIEQILGLAPAARVDVYEAPNSAQGDLDAYTAMVQNPSVKVISTSWGECEAANGSALAQAENTIFEEAAAQGQSVYAAAGDAGSTDCDGTSSRLARSLGVDDPGSQPYVTSVGGTRLLSDTDPSSQTAWNDSSTQLGAGGGGVSLQWTMPAYQENASSSVGLIKPGFSSTSACAADTGTTGAYCRQVPDVSADADPETGYVVYFSAEGYDWTGIAGTSAAAPLWAAMTALANASTYCGTASIGFANPILYGIADDAGAYSADFTDVSSGDTDYTPSGYEGGLYPATSGYDMATGLGTPNAATLVPAMCIAAGGPGTAPTIVDTGSGSGSSNSASSGSTLGAGSGTTPPAGTSSTPVASTPAPAPTTTGPATSAAGSTAVSSSATGSTTPSGAGAVGSDTTKPAACKLITLHAGASTLALTKHRSGAQMSMTLSLAAGCGSYALSLQHHITTTEAHGARAVDTLKIQLLSRSGQLLTTLSTLSNANAATGYQTLRLNLAHYSGERVTLRLLATRRGAGATDFTLRSVALNLS